MSDDQSSLKDEELREFADLYLAFTGHRPWPTSEPEGFRPWILNLHDVFLNVDIAHLALQSVPASDFEAVLAEQGASRQQRLARFLARDLWVLLEAWQRRPQFHEAFSYRVPGPTASLEATVRAGDEHGWTKRLRSVRDYMNHRDKKAYDDRGRELLPDEMVRWMQELRQRFSDLLLTAIGLPAIPLNPGPDARATADSDRTAVRSIVTAAVDEYLTAALLSLEDAPAADPEGSMELVGHYGRAFTTLACSHAVAGLECLTALVRRSVVVWDYVGAGDELRELLLKSFADSDVYFFLVAVVAPHDGSVTPTLGHEDLPGQSKSAVYRVTEWFNGHGDLQRALSAGLASTVILASVARGLTEEPLKEFVSRLGREGDALLAG